MTEHSSPSIKPAPAVAHQADAWTTRRLVSVGLGLGLAVALLFGAWLMTGQQGFDRLGQGGVNLQLLPRVGDPAPDIVTMLGSGEIVRLSDFRGQPVWLNFWGSWCPPCRSEAPDMQAAHVELAPRGLVMLAVSLDEPLATAVDYAQLNGLTYLIAGDPERKLTGAAYPSVNVPTHILIDRDGIVQKVILSELNYEQFMTYGEALLATTTEQ